MAIKRKIDFTNVKESSGISSPHIEPGDYAAKITKVVETMKDDVPMWCYHIQLDERKSAVYAFYCKLQENQFWKLRQLLTAAGKNVPRRAVSVDAESIVGKQIGITLEDDEYEGKLRSTIAAVFPISELEDEVVAAEDDDDLEEDDDEEPEEKPAVKKKPAAKKKPVPVEDDDDEDDEELDLDEL